jgi:Ca2+-dependent lipid-binding protein
LFTLLGLPRIEPSVVALSRAMPNIMNLPIISGFVSSALDTAAAEYVAPKSLILDVQRLLGGSDVLKDTQSLGVLIVHIHRATDIKGMDNDGKSGPSRAFLKCGH